jgi:hydroxybutyrate-dimer hydrolase
MMSKNRIARLLPLAVVLASVGCAGLPMPSNEASPLISPIEQQRYAGDDDLLTAGLGAAGLKSPAPPAFADAEHPTPAELRRRAIWNNWRGIADLAPGGGYGELYGYLQPVPGREYHALAKLPQARQAHRVMVQVPDSFDAGKRCIVVTASSGSRGIYGAIALAGSWGLAHGCAVAYTDKGGGTGYVDTATGLGIKVDGTRATSDGDIVEFSTARSVGAEPAPIAVKHAHSGDNPEADWGRHVRQAAEFALQVLNMAHPESAPYTFANTRVIAVGVSNGGGAVLRAAELPGDWLDGVVAVSPNIYPGEGSRAVYDYGMEAALYMPCALNASAYDGVAMARPGGAKSAIGIARCASLHAAGMLQADSPDQGAEEARATLLANGWTDVAISAGALTTAFDLWRAIAVTYASAYARTSATNMPCGYSFHATDAKGAIHAPGNAEQAAWWSDATGIPPGVGIGIQDALASGPDPGFAGLQCLRGLWQNLGEVSTVVQASVAATQAKLPREGLPVLVMHGVDDGLLPEAFSSAPYARWAKAAGRDVRYWRVANAQHFDTFLGLPAMASQYVPMLPYAYHGLDAMWAHLADGKALPGDADILTSKRRLDGAVLAPLKAENLGKMP